MAVENDPPRLIADRYQVQETLGSGGMSVVYQVVDASTQKKLALKQMRTHESEKHQRELAKLFEREFHILSQLAHPRVIEVYDYGLDDAGPYYTMELLDGGDLRGLSPLSWKKACSLLRDICSALSLLHSRRLIHRDLTPRNVRCTQDGRAKLIDLGGLAPMGPCTDLFGTPPFTAPEVVNAQVLDGRADLFSLGATAYYTLTGRHAFPARNFSELRDLWRSQPHPPSSFSEDIPEELDTLVASLLSIDALARPSNAAEVMEKLSAVAGLEADEQLSVSHVYLSAPALQGREDELLRVRNQVLGALGKRGSTVVIEGVAGVGRSRFLDACVLEGTLAGAVVLRAAASSAHAGQWGAVRALSFQLLKALPEAASQAVKPHLPVLSHVLPDLLDRFKTARQASSVPPVEGPWVRIASSRPSRISPAAELENGPPSRGAPSPPVEQPESDPQDRSDLAASAAAQQAPERPLTDPRAQIWARGSSLRPRPPAGHNSVELEVIDDPRELRPRVHAALRDWLLEVSSRHCLMLAVDDVHKLDEPSAALVALLAHGGLGQMLLIVVTRETDAPAVSPGAVRLLSEAGSTIKLRNLALHQTEMLLGSVFGDVPNLKLLADRLQRVSMGNPRAAMQLARHLVDRGAVRYHAGAWTLPSRIDVTDLPDTLADAFEARMQKLGCGARLLGGTMALSPAHGFTFDECLALSEHKQNAKLIQDLEELIACEIVTTDGDYYAISQEGWLSPLTGALEEEKKRSLHLRLAEVFQSRETDEFRVVQHLFKAGEETRSLDLLIRLTASTRERIRQDAEVLSLFVHSLPQDWAETFEALRKVCRRLGRPPHENFWLHRDLVYYSSFRECIDRPLLLDLIDILSHASGLQLYHELPDSMTPPARLTRAMELAQQRFDATPESERILSPLEAIEQLVRAMALASKLAGTALDHGLVTSMPSMEPFVPLAPAIGVLEKATEGLYHVTVARYEKARQAYCEVLDRLAQPDRAGLDASRHKYSELGVMYAVGMVEAILGIASAMKWTDRLGQDPAFEINAWRIRMVYHLGQGDAEKAEETKKRIELLQIQRGPIQFFEGGHLWSQLLVYAASDDLIRVKQTLDGIEKMAELFDSWLPVLRYGRGEYHRLRGDYRRARRELQKTLNETEAGCHVVWSPAAGSLVKTLFECKRFSEAVELARRLLTDAENADLGIMCNYVRDPLALAEAAMGEYESAIRRSEVVVDAYKSRGITGVSLGSAYENRARIAVFMQDQESFRRYAGLCAEQYRVDAGSALTAKYERLMGHARQAKLPAFSAQKGEQSGDVDVDSGRPSMQLVASRLTACRGARERAQSALELLLEYSKCSGGFLYTVQQDGAVLSATSGCQPLPGWLDAMAQRYLSAEIEDAQEKTMSVADLGAAAPGHETSEWHERFRSVLLGHRTGRGFAITGLAVMVMAPNEAFSFPNDVLFAVSKSLLDAGDVATRFASYG